MIQANLWFGSALSSQVQHHDLLGCLLTTSISSPFCYFSIWNFLKNLCPKGEGGAESWYSTYLIQTNRVFFLKIQVGLQIGMPVWNTDIHHKSPKAKLMNSHSYRSFVLNCQGRQTVFTYPSTKLLFFYNKNSFHFLHKGKEWQYNRLFIFQKDHADSRSLFSAVETQ